MSNKEKISKVKNDLHLEALHEDPSQVIFLLLAEIRALNSRLGYVLGVLSIITVLFLAHIAQGFVR